MASLGYANAWPRLKTDAVPDILFDILNPGKSVKRVGYEKRKKAEVLNTLLTDNSGEAEHNLKTSATESHEHILEANSAEYATQIWSPPSDKQKGVNIQCQTNFKSLLKFRNRHVQARPDIKSKGTQAVARISDVGIQCSLVKLPPLHILSSNITEDPESCLDLEEPGDIDSSNTDQDPDYVPDSEMRDVEYMESELDEMLPLHNNKLVDERYFIVSESKLFELLKVKICQHCKSDCVVHVKSVLGTMLTVNSTWSWSHFHMAQSESMPENAIGQFVTLKCDFSIG